MALCVVPKALLTLPGLWQRQSIMQRSTVTASFQWTGTPAAEDSKAPHNAVGVGPTYIPYSSI